MSTSSVAGPSRPARATALTAGEARLPRIEGSAFRTPAQRSPHLGVALLAQPGAGIGAIIDRVCELPEWGSLGVADVFQ